MILEISNMTGVLNIICLHMCASFTNSTELKEHILPDLQLMATYIVILHWSQIV